MNRKLLSIGLFAACVVGAGASFLTARAETLPAGFHQHSGAVADGVMEHVICDGHAGTDAKGEAVAGYSAGKINYRALGQSTIVVLGGSTCCPTSSNCLNSFYWAASDKWTSKRTWVSSKHCPTSKPYSLFGACKVGDGFAF